MIESLIFLGLFYIVFRVVGGNTYTILLGAAAANVLAYPFTNEYSVLLQASLDFVILTTLIFFADRDKTLQISLLFAAMVSHLLLELMRSTAPDILFYAYGVVITIITLWQLSGGGYAVIDRLFERIFNNHNTDGLFNFSFDAMDTQTCQKQEQKY